MRTDDPRVHLPTRRTLLLGAGALAASPWLPGCAARREPRVGPGEKLRLGMIGCANRGWDNIVECKDEQIVALCDVDERSLAKAAEQFPAAKRFADFRAMLEMQDLHAVVVSTPDHTHAVATARALRKGLDVYCEKPLTHTVKEARTIATLAREQGAVTQLGTQIHQWENYHRVVELVQSGMLGPVLEAHAFCDKQWSARSRPQETAPVPAHLHWDLWLGPAAERPFHDSYHPAGWRRYWDFGGGTLADMGCHYLDLAFWALGLGQPTSIRAQGPPVDGYAAPHSLEVEWRFPARGAQPPVVLRWYDGTTRCAKLGELGLAHWKNGVLFVGERGALACDYTKRELAPKGKLDALPPPAKTITDGVEHHREWLAACRTRATTSCDFAYAANLTEAVLLGSVAYRAGRPLAWDAASMRIAGDPEAELLLGSAPRPGFEL